MLWQNILHHNMEIYRKIHKYILLEILIAIYIVSIFIKLIDIIIKIIRGTLINLSTEWALRINTFVRNKCRSLKVFPFVPHYS